MFQRMLDIGQGGSSGGTDVSDTTAIESDVLDGKVFHLADGSSAVGTLEKRVTILRDGESGAGWQNWSTYPGTATQDSDGKITFTGANKYGGNTAFFKQVDLTHVDFVLCEVFSIGDTSNNRVLYASTTQYCATAWTDFSISAKYIIVPSSSEIVALNVKSLSGTYYIGFGQSNNKGNIVDDTVRISYGAIVS